MGKHAFYFDPDDVDGMVTAMTRAKAGTLIDAAGITAAKRHADSYTWEDTARKTMDIYGAFGHRRM